MTTDMTGKELGQYKIVSELGRGGMGIVYRAYQKSLNREVALKILPVTLAVDDNLVKRFHREAEAAAGLSHPNIVQIFDINEINGIHFFAMEYLRGESLTQKIAREGPLTIKEAVRITAAVADALNYSHAEGIIHRDIKPGNIMIDPQGHVKVTDFGLARAMESSRLTMTGTIIGTPEYMSPEQARGDVLDGRADLYSLGIVFFETLTGRIPFAASTPFAVANKQISEPLPLPRALRPDIPEILEVIILKATGKTPEQRYQKGSDLKNDLEVFISGAGWERITPTMPLSAKPAVKKKRRWPMVVLVIIMLLVVLKIAATNKKRELLEREKEKAALVKKHEKSGQDNAVLSSGDSSQEKEDAQKIIDRVLRLIDDKNYDKAVSGLEEFMQKFPDHPQTAMIPDWIKEIRDVEPREKFKRAQELADKGNIFDAILEFNKIAAAYPRTEWEGRAEERVNELKQLLKENEAEKEFLGARRLVEENSFIEAAQAYQSIIEHFPNTDWAQKAKEEIERLKEAQTRFKEKMEAVKERVQQGRRPVRGLPPEAEGIIEDIKRDPVIEKMISQGDDRKLAQYLWTQHKGALEDVADSMGIRIGRRFPYAVARYISGDNMIFERNPGQDKDHDSEDKEEFDSQGEFDRPEESRYIEKDRPPEREIRREEKSPDEVFEQLKTCVTSDPLIQKHVKNREVQKLEEYLMKRYTKELMSMSKEIRIPLKDLVREFSSRLVFEKEDKMFRQFSKTVDSDSVAQGYINTGDIDKLERHLEKKYYSELRPTAKTLGLEFSEITRIFAERLINEKYRKQY